jgi:chemotaxis protein methyltransferase CheR
MQPIGNAWAKLPRIVLLGDFGALGRYDVVFCRNVLIYFDFQTKAGVLARVRRSIENDGFLFLGGSETVIGVSEAFQPTPGRRGVYTPV